MKEIKNQSLDYVKYQKAVNDVYEKYSFVHKNVIGKSVMGKNIYALKIGEGEETVLYAAAFHGSEHITTNIALMFCHNLCEAINKNKPLCDIDIKRALNGRSITVIPRVNPDGADISILGEKGAGEFKSLVRKLSGGDYAHYNANARGVDINHNFRAGWDKLKAVEKAHGIYCPAARRFGGYAPESEPETAALVRFCREEKVKHVAAFHTQGEVIYWNFGEHTPKDSKRMAKVLSSVSGYALDVPIGIATGGGFKDFFIEEFCRPGFTIEFGKGENPLQIKDTAKIYQKAEEMLTILAIM
ncbi:MAG: M14 family metallocarboxypeptidase [Clostridia bacterium]|nr:M14 family metallocarboxypeptidase [Clostridia bacterium]